MINTSSVLANYFNQARLTLGIKRTLAGDCETRWNSTYYLVDSFIELKVLIVKFFGEKNFMDVRRTLIKKMISIELQHDDWTMLGDIRTVLRPFNLATKLMSGRSYPTAGLSYYVIVKLHRYLLEVKDDSAQVRSLKKSLLTKFEYYFLAEKEQIKLLKVNMDNIKH